MLINKFWLAFGSNNISGIAMPKINCDSSISLLFDFHEISKQ
jgi:hypothetical protein